MQRRKLVQHLQQHGCELVREDGSHSIYWNPKNGNTAPILRHREVADPLARRICREFDIPTMS